MHLVVARTGWWPRFRREHVRVRDQLHEAGGARSDAHSRANSFAILYDPCVPKRPKKSPPVVPTVPVAPATPSPDPTQQVNFLRWSCDRLAAQLESERTRRSTIRRDAHATMLLAFIPLGFYLSATRGITLSTVEAVLAVILILVVGLDMAFWCAAMRVKPVTAFNDEALTQHDGTVAENDFEARYRGVRDHFQGCVRSAERTGSDLAQWRSWCLWLATVAVVLVLVLFLLRIGTMASSDPREKESPERVEGPEKPPAKPAPTKPVEPKLLKESQDEPPLTDGRPSRDKR